MSKTNEEVNDIVNKLDVSIRMCFMLLTEKYRDILKRNNEFVSESQMLEHDKHVFNSMMDDLSHKVENFDDIRKYFHLSKITTDDVFTKLSNFEIVVSDDGDAQKFFSEGYLYNTIGKDNARTLLSYMRQVFSSAGRSCDF